MEFNSYNIVSNLSTFGPDARIFHTITMLKCSKFSEDGSKFCKHYLQTIFLVEVFWFWLWLHYWLLSFFSQHKDDGISFLHAAYISGTNSGRLMYLADIFFFKTKLFYQSLMTISPKDSILCRSAYCTNIQNKMRIVFIWVENMIATKCSSSLIGVKKCWSYNFNI